MSAVEGGAAAVAAGSGCAAPAGSCSEPTVSILRKEIELDLRGNIGSSSLRISTVFFYKMARNLNELERNRDKTKILSSFHVLPVLKCLDGYGLGLEKMFDLNE